MAFLWIHVPVSRIWYSNLRKCHIKMLYISYKFTIMKEVLIIKRRKAGALGGLSSGSSGPAGNLGYSPQKPWLEAYERTLSQKQPWRR